MASSMRVLRRVPSAVAARSCRSARARWESLHHEHPACLQGLQFAQTSDGSRRVPCFVATRRRDYQLMTVLSVNAVDRWYGARQVLAQVSFRVEQGDRVGLVGANGTGKTALLRIAAGLDSPDRGGVAYARRVRKGFLQQELL